MSSSRTPHDLAWPDLIWSHFSRPRHGGFDERVAAASSAGFSAIGLYVSEYRRLREDEGRSAADIRGVLDDHGVMIGEIETIVGWSAAASEQNATTCTAIEALAYEMADEFGCRYLQAIGSYEGTVDNAADGFGALCDRAADHGLKVGIEWLPFTNIYDANDAQAIVERAARPNGGYCADIWHHTRGSNDAAMLTALDPAKIFAIQMNDGPIAPGPLDYKTDCLTTRVPPGQGEFDCVGFLSTLRAMGVDAPISMEVCSTELWAMPAADAARASADGIRRVLTDVKS